MVVPIHRILFCVVIGLSVTNCLAADHFFSVDIHGIEFKNGKLPKTIRSRVVRPVDFWRARMMYPYVSLENAGEAYVSGAELWEATVTEGQDPARPKLSVKSSVDKDVFGWLFWPKSDFSGYVKLRFVLPKSSANMEHRIPFLEAKLVHYQTQFKFPWSLSSGVVGAAWFRHQIHKTAVSLKKEVPQPPSNRRFFGNRSNDVSQTYALFSGGRALSENLQLDRQLSTTKQEKETVPLDSIKGITIYELAWGTAIEEAEPTLDYLARDIPQDQYVIFFPSFQAMVSLADEASEQGAPVLTLAEPSGENAMVQERYERQLCLKLDTSARLFGSGVIESVAMTGSDPYFRTGTDVAVLFQAKNPEIVRTFVDAQKVTRGGKYKSAKPVQGEFMDVGYTGMRSPDRVICSYSVTLDKTVVVTNSLVQLKRLILTHQKQSLSLSELPEFKFFRQRYRLGDEKETAFLVISDPTIRRWCGPRWRIGSSRRTRAAATIAEMQALYLDALANEQATSEVLTIDPALPEAGVLSLSAYGVSSSVYGSLGFQTPIAELDFTQVTSEEANLYARWRDGYQRYWSNFFDPIAVRFQLNKSRISADVSVVPLIDSSDYQPFIDIAKGIKLPPDFGDLHPESILHAILAINTDSSVLRQNTTLLQSIVPQITTSPLSWIGNGVAVYVDQDPFWEDFNKAFQAADGDVEKVMEDFMDSQIRRLPLAVHVDVKNGLKLTLFLAAVRGFLNTTTPGMLNWETLNYREQPYVKVSPSAEALPHLNALTTIALYYSATGEALIATMNEALLKRAIDRRLARRQNDREQLAGNEPQAKENDPSSATTDVYWIGESMGLQAKKELVMLIERVLDQSYRLAMQRLSWANLPILNEWKRRYPQSDPVVLHERLWERRLVCPGGGKYVWNDEWQTMESTVFGHPGVPNPGTGLPSQLKDIKSANFGVTFERIEALEENGLRARLELTR